MLRVKRVHFILTSFSGHREKMTNWFVNSFLFQCSTPIPFSSGWLAFIALASRIHHTHFGRVWKEKCPLFLYLLCICMWQWDRTTHWPGALVCCGSVAGEQQNGWSCVYVTEGLVELLCALGSRYVQSYSEEGWKSQKTKKEKGQREPDGSGEMLVSRIVSDSLMCLWDLSQCLWLRKHSIHP